MAAFHMAAPTKQKLHPVTRMTDPGAGSPTAGPASFLSISNAGIPIGKRIPLNRHKSERANSAGLAALNPKHNLVWLLAAFLLLIGNAEGPAIALELRDATLV